MDRGKKGFSLFTPLIGTTIIVIAAIVSAMMLQNDVRISRTLSSSFEQANQENAAKLIKATADVEIRREIDKGIIDYFSNSNPVYSYTSETSCGVDEKIKNGVAQGIRNYLQTRLYSRIIDEVGSSTGYNAQRNNINCPNPNGETEDSLENCIAQGLAHTIVKLSEDSSNSDVYKVKFSIENGYEGDFAVKFKDSQGQAMILSLKPDTSKEYSTKVSAKYIADETEQICKSLRKRGDTSSYRDKLLNFAGVVKTIEIKGRHASPQNGQYNLIKITYDKNNWHFDNDYTVTLVPEHHQTSSYIHSLCKLENGNIAGSLSIPPWIFCD